MQLWYYNYGNFYNDTIVTFGAILFHFLVTTQYLLNLMKFRLQYHYRIWP